jgi:hypothetical protein
MGSVPRLASLTLAFALQLRKGTEKKSQDSLTDIAAAKPDGIQNYRPRPNLVCSFNGDPMESGVDKAYVKLGQEEGKRGRV